MKKTIVSALFIFLSLLTFKNAFSQGFDTDIAGYGFTTGIGAKEIPAGSSGQVSNHNLKVDIPQGTFPFPVTFEILQGQNSYFQGETPSGRIIITNFAFRVRNHATDQLVRDFKRPVLVTLILPDDASDVEVWKVELTRPARIVKCTDKTEVGDKTLMLQAESAATGWIITSSTGNIKTTPGEETGEDTGENVFLDLERQPDSVGSSLALPILGVIAIGAVLIYLIKR